LAVTRPILAVLDGAKALVKGVRQVFGQPLIQRCIVHYAEWPVMWMRGCGCLAGGDFVLGESA